MLPLLGEALKRNKQIMLPLLGEALKRNKQIMLPLLGEALKRNKYHVTGADFIWEGLQSNFNGSNTFGTLKTFSRQG